MPNERTALALTVLAVIALGIVAVVLLMQLTVIRSWRRRSRDNRTRRRRRDNRDIWQASGDRLAARINQANGTPPDPPRPSLPGDDDEPWRTGPDNGIDDDDDPLPLG